MGKYRVFYDFFVFFFIFLCFSIKIRCPKRGGIFRVKIAKQGGRFFTIKTVFLKKQCVGAQLQPSPRIRGAKKVKNGPRGATFHRVGKISPPILKNLKGGLGLAQGALKFQTQIFGIFYLKKGSEFQKFYDFRG